MSKTVFSFGLIEEFFKRDSMVFVKEFRNRHGSTANRASNRVVAESGKDSKAPTGERTESPMFFQRDGSSDPRVGLTVASIDAVITDHLEMFFGDVADQSLDKVHGRNGFIDKTIILVPVVMKGNGVSNLVVGINTGSSNNGATEITTDVFKDGGRGAFTGFGIDIETVFCVSVNGGLYPFKFRRKLFLEQIQKDGLECLAQVGIVEVRDMTPETTLINAAFRNKTVDVRVPFEVTSEGVQNADETRGEMPGVVQLKEQVRDHLVDGREEQI